MKILWTVIFSLCLVTPMLGSPRQRVTRENYKGSHKPAATMTRHRKPAPATVTTATKTPVPNKPVETTAAPAEPAGKPYIKITHGKTESEKPQPAPKTTATEFYILGETSAKNGDILGAAVYWQETLRLKPDSATTAKRLASLNLTDKQREVLAHTSDPLDVKALRQAQEKAPECEAIWRLIALYP
jgi:hypothetical protein